jgi:hypothetical protein
MIGANVSTSRSLSRLHGRRAIQNAASSAWLTGLGSLCGGDLDREIKINVWDEESVSSTNQIGIAKFPVKSLLLKQPIVLSDYKVPSSRTLSEHVLRRRMC